MSAKKKGMRRLSEGARSLPLFCWRPPFRAGLLADLRQLSTRCCARLLTSRASFCFVQLPCTWRRPFGWALTQARLAGAWRGTAGASLPFSLSFRGSRRPPCALPSSSFFLLLPRPRARGANRTTYSLCDPRVYIPSRSLGGPTKFFFVGKGGASQVASFDQPGSWRTSRILGGKPRFDTRSSGPGLPDLCVGGGGAEG